MAGDQPDVLAAARDFLAWRGTLTPVPDRSEAEAYLADLRGRLGDKSAHRVFGFLLPAAAMIWGRAETAHLARVQREARCSIKPARKTEWERAERAIAALPDDWQAPFHTHLARSRDKPNGHRRSEIWSASHSEAVALALRYWATFCAASGCPHRPTGETLERFAQAKQAEGVSVSSVADYMDRIRSGFAMVLEPGFASDACDYVIADWEQRGKCEGTPTKRTADIVPATEVYELGFTLMTAAEAQPFYGIGAARSYRNGLILSVGTAVPQRARALSAFDFSTTCRLLDRPLIAIRLPGTVLKRREHRKQARPYSATFENDRLWAALDLYRRKFRPLFDDGTCLFPSVKAPGAAISEKQIGRLAAAILNRHLGVNGTIHHLRDYVATEASEEMLHGGRLAPALLDHTSDATTKQHYDHAEGLKATRTLADFITKRQSKRPRLLV
ncbi:hypothetical protein [Rhodovulum adriaticum]|uniref:hypothetical protein n=1 Tax=Rhodovulum adriaticum TaxID=35804 RepID=UPI00104D26C9|nr:hypothetical protein [Rhodovulum adriaticum]